MLSSGINGKVFNVVYNIYNKAKSCVKSDDRISNTFKSNVGVRQGENLSPLLFALYLSDFDQFLSTKYSGLSFFENQIRDVLNDNELDHFIRLYTLLYADDTIILSESESELQHALNGLYEYCRLWKLKVNLEKTNIIIFTGKGSEPYKISI